LHYIGLIYLQALIFTVLHSKIKEPVLVKIALASDHAGFKYKEKLKEYLESKGHIVEDFGTYDAMACDYPDFVRPAAQSVADGLNDYAVVFGGSGNGEAIVANKVKGIRCGVCWNESSARLTKEHNNANIISIGERMVNENDLIPIVEAWLNAEFEGGRHQKRIDKIE
jgi:ribose 5-phosphate isomerase B